MENTNFTPFSYDLHTISMRFSYDLYTVFLVRKIVFFVVKIVFSCLFCCKDCIFLDFSCLFLSFFVRKIVFFWKIDCIFYDLHCIFWKIDCIFYDLHCIFFGKRLSFLPDCRNFLFTKRMEKLPRDIPNVPVHPHGGWSWNHITNIKRIPHPMKNLNSKTKSENEKNDWSHFGILDCTEIARSLYIDHIKNDLLK